jgi:hypothetical protein|tara:strand:+ start:447 stop:650 length:204 start_codon:yes stop_codon:yes gene_type:complete
MTYLNAHTQEYLSKENQSLSNELKLKLSDAYSRIRTLEFQLQDSMVLVCNLKDELYLRERQKKSNGK